MTKLVLALFSITLLSCGSKGADQPSTPPPAAQQPSANTPTFDADSAYTYVANQVNFGPRVPNTPAHKAGGDYLVNELKRFGAQVHQQEMKLTAYNNTVLDARNIIGSYNPDNNKRVLLFAHWDSRPYADEDANPDNHNKAIDGADDGASGVGVLLETARQINQNDPGIGIDIIFFDAEDYGPPSQTNSRMAHPWALGSQFWAKKPHVPNYRAEYGILLDMVGSKGATFFKEYTSVASAAPIVERIWSTARDLGYGRYFINAMGGGVTDDHTYIIRDRKIPCVDIINYDAENNRNGFGDYWHTMDDNIDIINKETLKAVGQTVLEVIYKK